MRLFVGIAIPSSVKAEIGSRGKVRRRLPAARWVAIENLHLTLSFLGEVAEAQLPGMSQALGRAFARREPLTLQFAGAGWFPPGRAARVLWLGLEDGAALQQLQSDVARELEETLGVEREKRPYDSHLTLARCSRPWPRRAAESWAATFAGTVGEAFEVRQGHLFRSHLGRGGATYEILESFSLRGDV